MEATHRVLIRNLREHSRLTREDLDEIGSLTYSIRQLEADEDFICQGDVPKVAALVVRAWLPVITCSAMAAVNTCPFT